MDSSYIELLAIIILIAANGFFAASEFALIAARRSRIIQWVKQGHPGAMRTKELLQKPDRFLAAIQIGITVISTLAGVFGGATLVKSLIPIIERVPIPFISNAANPIAIAVVVLFISGLSLLLGELVPKYIALADPERLAIRVSRPISILSRSTSFLVSFLAWATRKILKLFGFSKVPEESHVTEEEINILIAEGLEKGAFDPTEQRLIKSVFDFSDTTVRQVMTPRVDIVGVEVNWPQEKLLETMARHGYSRYPVYETSLDQIVGIIYTKDLILMTAAGEKISQRTSMRSPLFVPDSMPLRMLLSKFQRHQVHMAIVLDEFGGTAGLITLEDILEEIVGEIHDEHDEAQPEYTRHSERVAFAAGSIRPDDLNQALSINLPTETSDTLAGLIIETLGRVPDQGEEVVIRDVHLKVLRLDGNRIRRVRIEKTPSAGKESS